MEEPKITMYCPNCDSKREVLEGEVTCPKCGSLLEPEPAPVDSEGGEEEDAVLGLSVEESAEDENYLNGEE